MVFAVIGLQLCNQKLLIQWQQYKTSSPCQIVDFFSELPCIYQQFPSAKELAGIKTRNLGDIAGVTGTLQRSGKGDLFVDMNGYLKLIGTSVRRACLHAVTQSSP